MSVFAVVPVKDLRNAKSRLTSNLGPAVRAGLTLQMMDHVVFTLKKAGIPEVCVVSPDRVVLDAARRSGATPLSQRSTGLNRALDEGRRWAVERRASSLLVIPADLPFLEGRDVQSLLEGAGGTPYAVISPDDARAGTNALLLNPPDAMPFAFGEGSFAAHLRLASELGLRVRVCDRPHLAFDLDTSEDLARLAELEKARTRREASCP